LLLTLTTFLTPTKILKNKKIKEKEKENEEPDLG
jgi:hypothetical protein